MSASGACRSVAEVLVVGGGPAGAAAAALLARAGVGVTVIEQSRFPRQKVCGECLSDLGMKALEAGGLWGAVRQLQPAPLDRARFAAVDGREVEVDLPSPMWGVTRGALDVTLLEAARHAGAKVIQPARVERLASAGATSLPAAVVRDLSSNQVRAIEADLLLLADGKCALLDEKPRATAELGLKGHFERVEADSRSISLFGLRGHYVGLAPVSDGSGIIWNLAAAVPARRVRHFGGDHEALLAAMQRENPGLDRALRGATRISDWLACPLPRFTVRRSWPPGVIPLGNAAAALEPIGGEGMGLAIASASLAARFVVEGRTSGAELAELRREYARLWRRRSIMWRGLAMLLSRPKLARVGISTAKLAPGVASAAAALAQAARTPARSGLWPPDASVLS